MYRGTMKFITGMGAGMVAGAIVLAAGSKRMKGGKRFRRNAGKTIHAVGDLIDNVQYMFR